MDRMSLEAIRNVLWMLLSKYCKKDCSRNKREDAFYTLIMIKFYINNKNSIIIIKIIGK
ncbi:TPA: hypothetical protein KQE37_003812 [Clostridioides difficile]|nr:hypothetical protein [Clostridioides difficile]HBF7558970.1 hypothetical protein [Clostridioides difficile]HBG4552342.1 hypothetical protein [Clostridioides difficile]